MSGWLWDHFAPYWYLRAWICDHVHLRCPSCKEADECE